MKQLSRRTFLHLSSAAAAGALLTACAPAPASPTGVGASPTPAASATPTEVGASPTPVASPTMPSNPATNYRRPELIRFYPAGQSKVVRARDAQVWKGEAVDPAAVRGLVDKSITALTGIAEAKNAWQALFDPKEKIAIKVNVFRNSTIWTHFELVKAVADSLQEAGIPGENITIFDYSTEEFQTAKYPVNKDGPGVRCRGTDGAYSSTWRWATNDAKLSDILTQSDALINMPVLKSHMIAGFTFALKNHYGSVSYPDGLHGITNSLPGLNALPPIKDATRLVIGDVLHANTQWSNGWPYWDADVKGDSILMSYDPLAHDVVGLQMLLKLAEQKGSSTEGILGMSDSWLKAAQQAGLGALEMKDIDLVEI